MTYQVKNTLILNEKKFSIIKTTNEGLIKPQDLGIEAKYRASTLMRGYLTSYKIDSQSNLVLSNFWVNVNMNADIKFINGIPPHVSSKTNVKSRTTYREYRNLDLSVNYSGNILIGRNLISGLDAKYRLYGANYEEVFELNIKNGKVISVNNLSEKILQHKLNFKNGDWETDIQSEKIDKEILKWLFKDIEF